MPDEYPVPGSLIVIVLIAPLANKLTVALAAAEFAPEIVIEGAIVYPSPRELIAMAVTLPSTFSVTEPNIALLALPPAICKLPTLPSVTLAMLLERFKFALASRMSPLLPMLNPP